ncbi:MAG: hypothetical protein KDJ22_13370, partial [Candidatus Competibacteraceae bacterium]|nr:hypothetical protein [Candidatus Competibacteraceae bacterium]
METSSIIPNTDVVAASNVGVESLIPLGSVAAPGGVVVESTNSLSSVIAPGGVVVESLIPLGSVISSEEGGVGKESSFRWALYHEKKKLESV